MSEQVEPIQEPNCTTNNDNVYLSSTNSITNSTDSFQTITTNSTDSAILTTIPLLPTNITESNNTNKGNVREYNRLIQQLALIVLSFIFFSA